MKSCAFSVRLLTKASADGEHLNVFNERAKTISILLLRYCILFNFSPTRVAYARVKSEICFFALSI